MTNWKEYKRQNLDLPDEQDLKKETKQNQAHQDNPKNHGSDNLNTI